jgi:ectoine hydroxylase-related dioxygenase (phytanoyl-CoA dioxygenase family)
VTESVPAATALSELERDGYAILPDVLSGEEVQPLVAAIEAHVAAVGAEGQAGLRTLAMQLPEVRAMRAHPKLIALASKILGSPAFVVRTLLFDKTPGANWKVPWHQDLTIAVHERRDLDGFAPWSVKDGVPHVQPPSEFLARMITLRIHLDDCLAENGALRVLPGTHRSGRLSPAEITQAREQSSEAICEVSQGGLLIMRPLLLHASSPAVSPRHRRVLHLEFAAEHLPEGLAWAEDNACN